MASTTTETVEYNPKTMDFKDKSSNSDLKEPIRNGWENGDGHISKRAETEMPLPSRTFFVQ